MIATVLIGISTGFIFLVRNHSSVASVSVIHFKHTGSKDLVLHLSDFCFYHQNTPLIRAADLNIDQVCLLLVSGGSDNVQNIIESTAGPLLAIFYKATGSRAGSICLLMYVCPSATDSETSSDIFSKVPSHLSAIRYDQYHDHKQSHDLCFRQVCSSTAQLSKLAGCRITH